MGKLSKILRWARNFSRRRYRLMLEDESRLERVWSVKAGLLRLAVVFCLVLAAGIGIGVLLVGFTPVKRQMPGYMTAEDRANTLKAVMSIDSLRLAADENQAFMDNLAGVLDTDRVPSDSIDALGKKQSQLSIDSLIGSSARERKFVAMMEESEKYNLKVLSPLAAEGLIWADPISSSIIVEQTRTMPGLQLIAPKNSNICSMADGRVIDRLYDASSQTYSLIIQHQKGFVSRYSSIGTPLVDKGDQVLSGQIIAASGKAKAIVIELWRDGTPLLPAEYIGRPGSDEPRLSFDSPRGR